MFFCHPLSYNRLAVKMDRPPATICMNRILNKTANHQCIKRMHAKNKFATVIRLVNCRAEINTATLSHIIFCLIGFSLACNQPKSGDIGPSLPMPDSAGNKTGRRSQTVLATKQ